MEVSRIGSESDCEVFLVIFRRVMMSWMAAMKKAVLCCEFHGGFPVGRRVCS